MKTLIYQYWIGDLPPGDAYGRDEMSKYANRIGADYRCDVNKPWHTAGRDPRITSAGGLKGPLKGGGYALKFDLLRPIYDEAFWDYDRVLYVDLDIYPVDALKANIFDEPVGAFGMCEEPDQPAHRAVPMSGHINQRYDEEWASRFPDVDLPRNDKGQLRVFNGGLVLYTQEGLTKLREQAWPIDKYARMLSGLPGFYAWDQNYMHLMAFALDMEFTLLSVEWNRQIHGLLDGKIYDKRNPETKFVHVMKNGADWWDDQTLWRVTNLPQNKWDIPT